MHGISNLAGIPELVDVKSQYRIYFCPAEE